MLRMSLKAIRDAAPEAIVILRGSRYDLSKGLACNTLMDLGEVGVNCECVETSDETHVYLHGIAARTGVRTTAENGWPGCHGEPTRAAIFKALMGRYGAYMYSAGHSNQLLPDLEEWTRYAYASACLASSHPPAPKMAMLISNSTELFAGPKTRNRYPIIAKALLRTNCPALATNSLEPQIASTRVDVLLDDGANAVVPRSARQEILSWVRSGGALVCSPAFGIADESGRCEESVLGHVRANGTKWPGRKELDVVLEEYMFGKGRVIVADFSRLSARHEAPTLAGLLSLAGIGPVLRVTPRLPAVLLKNDREAFILVYDLSPSRIANYFPFPEWPLDTGGTVAVSIDLPGGLSRAEDLLTGQPVRLVEGCLSFDLPRGTGKIIRLTATKP
jgi:hypothetical protein